MVDTARARKLADRIREIVAEALEKRVKDPRLGFVTVTDTRVTGDLQHATVFYTVLGDAEEQAATRAALESAKGVLRSEVGRRTGIRLTPTLEFVADAVPENAAHIDELLPPRPSVTPTWPRGRPRRVRRRARPVPARRRGRARGRTARDDAPVGDRQ